MKVLLEGDDYQRLLELINNFGEMAYNRGAVEQCAEGPEAETDAFAEEVNAWNNIEVFLYERINVW